MQPYAKALDTGSGKRERTTSARASTSAPVYNHRTCMQLMQARVHHTRGGSLCWNWTGCLQGRQQRQAVAVCLVLNRTPPTRTPSTSMARGSQTQVHSQACAQPPLCACRTVVRAQRWCKAVSTVRATWQMVAKCKRKTGLACALCTRHMVDTIPLHCLAAAIC